LTASGVSVDELLAAARETLDRVSPHRAAAAVAEGALLVDIRPDAQRRREGEIPGATLIERNVLEWRLAPSSAHRIDEVDEPGRVVVIVCSEGYASSLAAASLQLLGLRGATDLIGGFHAWEAKGLPTVAYRHGSCVDRSAPSPAPDLVPTPAAG
jgi:rhodanese-related sulfurtransferase